MGTNRSFGLPLLAKELIEQSARRRTYVIRTIYAILLFGFALMIFWGSIYSRISNPFELLGQGRQMFAILMVLQITGVALFTPALTCGTISMEKERNTIGLLFLTRLSPTAILLEKYLGRLFVMGTYLLISLPLFGFCYSLGGLEQGQVWFGFYGLIITVCQLAALGLLCSAYFRTTVSAFIATYLMGIAMFFGPIFLSELLPRRLARILFDPLWRLVEGLFGYLGRIGELTLTGFYELVGIEVGNAFTWNPVWQPIGYNSEMEFGFIFFAPILLMSATESAPAQVATWQLFALGVPAMGTTLLFLGMARLFVVRRAFISSKRYLLRFFQALDSLFHRANQNRFTKGIVLIKESNHLPVYDPIAWRETTKTPLGSVRYLFRIFVAIEFPVITICLMAITFSGVNVYQWHRNEAIVAVNLICWVIAILLTVVRAATLVAGERSHETLDVLLTTPISSHDFVTQKFRGVMRLMLVVSVPLLTGMISQAWYSSITGNNWLSGMFGSRPERNPICYLFAGVTSMVVYLQLFAWLSMLMGMWLKTSTRAIFGALALIVAWMILPLVFLITFFEIWNVSRHSPLSMLLTLSPATVPFMMEIGEIEDIFGDAVWAVIITNLMLYSALLFTVRWFTLKHAARLLGRSEDNWS